MVGKPEFNTQYIRLLEAELTSDSVADGDYIFTSVDKIDEHGPRNNVIDYFYFVDAQGDPIAATGGTVTITFSPEADLYQTIVEGAFDASAALEESRTKPNGYGKVQKVKITLAGVTGPAVGFRSLLTQSVS